jgi:hypothetical protein
MAEKRAIKRFVDVEIKKDTPSVSAASFGIPILISNSNIITTAQRVKRFTTLAGVETLFSSTTEEWKAADAYFSQDPFNENQPEELLIGRYVDADSSAVLEAGENNLTVLDTWKAVTNGNYAITLNGTVTEATTLDFSAVTSLDDVAGVLSAGIAGATVTYVINRFVFENDTAGTASTTTLLGSIATAAGVDISGADYIDGRVLKSVTNPGGSLLSQGQAVETAADMLTAIKNVNNSWYALGLIKALRDIQFTEDLSDTLESNRNVMITVTNDANALVLGSAASLAAKLKAKNYKRSSLVYHDNENVYPDWSWMGQQLPKDVGSTNWSYKTLAGIAEGASQNIEASAITQTQIDAAADVNANVYTTTLGASFIYFGTMTGGKNIDKEGEFIDIIINIDFLQARVEEGLMSLLLEKDIIPFTDGGITIVDTRLKNLLQTYGVVQGILVDGSVVTSFPKRSEVSQTDRDDRKLPGGTFTAELSGAINTVIVRGIVSI